MNELPEESKEPPPPVHTARGALWGVRVCALVALSISVYLAWLALTGRTAAGCGSGTFGCERVLSSKWAYVLNVPVSLPSISLWLSVVVVSLFAGQSRLPGLRQSAWGLLALLTTAAAGAAAWFIGLQALKLQHWCLYCLAAHGCAIVGWALVMLRGDLLPSARSSAAIAGLLLASALPLAQSWFPRPSYYNLHIAEDVQTDKPLVIEGLTSQASPVYIDVLGGAARVNLAGLPCVGNRDNKYVVVSLYDYACEHCRRLHDKLLEIQAAYPKDLTIVMLPTPLSHHCNPYLTEKQSTSPEACELARLALVVAQYQPARFGEFDAWLFATEEPRTAEEAYLKASALLTADVLAKAEADKQYDRLLRQHVELYHQSPAKLLPQIMGRNVVLSEGVESTGELLNALEREFGFRF